MIIEFEGNKYELLEQAELTNRHLPGAVNYEDVGMGEPYYFEVSAPAKSGQYLYTLYWIFKNIKGQEEELDKLDYSKVSYVTHEPRPSALSVNVVGEMMVDIEWVLSRIVHGEIGKLDRDDILRAHKDCRDIIDKYLRPRGAYSE